MGFPSPAQDYINKRIDWNEQITDHPLSTYYFRCNTSCMAQNGLPKGSILAVDFSETPVNGKIVVAKVQGEFIVRQLQKNDYTAKLLANDKRIADIVMTKEMEIIGVVKSMIIQFS